MNQNDSSSYPIYVDGVKVCEALEVSYTIDNNVELIGPPTRTEVIDYGPSEFTVEATLPEDGYMPIDHECRVEVAIPPDVHAGDSWRVLEVWEINRYDITKGQLELAAWNGKLHANVEYLGSDTDRASNGKRQTPDTYKTLQLLNDEDDNE